jgi:sirohydrochlorin cobaltochelatase
MTNSTPARGIVLFAHGSRDPLWHKPMEAVAQRVREQSPAAHVVCAYLELSQPDLPTATATLVEHGVSEITIVPMFLGVGKHAREDLPLIVAALRDSHPLVTFQLQRAVGENPLLVALLADIALEKL